MQRRSLTQLPSLGLIAAGCGAALALAAACSTTNPPPGPSPTAGTNPGVGGSAGSGGGDTGGSAGTGGADPGTGGTPPGGGTGGDATAGTGGGGGEPAPACKAVTAVNGSGLTVSATDISAFRYASPPANITKMAHDPVSNVVVVLGGNGSLYSFDPTVALPTTASTAAVTTLSPYDAGYSPEAGYGTGIYLPHRGIAFDAAGNLYVMAARGGNNSGVSIRKGAPPATPGGTRTWTTIVTTSQGFPASGTDYDHSFSGIAVSPNNDFLFISSGSRTEHGEVRGGMREVPLTAAILKLPVDGPTDLRNDETALQPYVYARGTRNAFDLAFNAAGDLIGTENGPDIDLPDELNFIEEGKHYGYPWRFGDVDNPTLNPAYSPNGDLRLNSGFGSVAAGTYVADPQFPAPPGEFTDPIRNMGPDANFLRTGPGAANPTKAGAEGLAGVTGHRSPLGLAFDVTGALCGEYYKAGFLLSFGALHSTLNDEGRDLLLVNLTKTDGTYTMTAKQLARGGSGFAPIDSVLVGNRLFVVGHADGAQLYVFELPTP